MHTQGQPKHQRGPPHTSLFLLFSLLKVVSITPSHHQPQHLQQSLHLTLLFLSRPQLKKLHREQISCSPPIPSSSTFSPYSSRTAALSALSQFSFLAKTHHRLHQITSQRQQPKTTISSCRQHRTGSFSSSETISATISHQVMIQHRISPFASLLFIVTLSDDQRSLHRFQLRLINPIQNSSSRFGLNHNNSQW